jgi:uncharacterized protein YyaL (SSP411 family)
MSHTNRLSAETSPYLLQHAHNPVDWYPWGEEALERARTENKPVLVSIGYAACHWCHVMERESFEDEETARFMNEHFVNIKIDREERPDLDHIYMDAVQAMTGSGGWPLNVFLTPEGKPFYGGTYFPPRPAYNRPSWKEVLSGLSRSFREKREDIDKQAESMTEHLGQSNAFGLENPGQGGAAGEKKPAQRPEPWTKEALRLIADNLLKTADKTEGGFGVAPKFPQTFSIRYLLHYYHFTKDEQALEQACLSLDKMIRGGIYDQLGGGFARYSTDGEWLAPHFEKMLYDNALLVIALCEAYQLTKKDLYRETIEQTLEFVRRELSLETGEGELAFYSALDADSEGVEGKYYVWDKTEIDAVLGEDSGLFCSFYGVREKGNWEGHTILTRPEAGAAASADAEGRKAGIKVAPEKEQAAREMEPDDRVRLEAARAKLLEHRSRRVRPALDDKVLLGWNALMNIACSKAYGALGVEKYRDWAVANAKFFDKRLKGNGLYFYYHSYTAGRSPARDAGGTAPAGVTGRGQAKFPGFLDDYACLISAFLHLQEITGNTFYLDEAKDLTQFVTDHFSEEGTGYFYFTHQEQKDLILRKKEVYDGAVPSGNSMMAFNLAYMSIIYDMPEWGERARWMAAGLNRLVTGYPGSFGIWATLYQAFAYVIPELVLTGKAIEGVRKEFLSKMIPYRVFQSATQENTHFPLLYNKPAGDSPLIFLCKNYTCQPPVNEIDTIVRLLENV